LRKAVTLAPDFPDGHNNLGWELAKTGSMEEAVNELQKAIALRPTSVEYRFNLGYVMTLRADFDGAVAAFEKAVELSDGKDSHCLAALADAYNKSGHSAEAIQAARHALDLALQQHDEELENKLRGDLDRYEGEAAKAQPRQ
jgi:Flp pilus assembly protein TadD